MISAPYGLRLCCAAAMLGIVAALPCAAQCQLAKLVARDAAPDDLFGRRVAMDGASALAAAHLHDDPNTNDGAAFLFNGQATHWTQDTKLVVGFPGRGLARSVALVGGVALVGSSSQHRLFVFQRLSDGSWQLAQALRSDDDEELDFFGRSVAFDGRTAVVGAPEDSNANGGDAGAAYVFERDPNGLFVRTAKLIASDGTGGDAFGLALAVQGNTIVVGAAEDDPFGFSSGSAYIFQRDPYGEWTPTAKLLPDDGRSLDGFATSVAVRDGLVMVGSRHARGGDASPGAAYVYEPGPNGVWTQTQKFGPPDGENSDWFGFSVALQGDLALIGARGDNGSGPVSGSAYAFARRPDGSWSQVARFQPDDLGRRDEFGHSVALSGNLAVVGAPFQDLVGDDGATLEDAGAAYVFAVGPDLDGDGFMDACLCMGDLDGDFVVGLSDLQRMLANFGARDLPDDPACRALWATRCAGDLDRDADVDISDLGLLLANYGTACP